jgi:hypothetical protein
MMPDPLWGTQLTNQMIANPWMFDPSQLSNQFSNYNNAALPYPPTYNGAPVNAATGKPIQSYQDWLQANPGGTTLNQTASAPAAAAQPDMSRGIYSMYGGAGPPNLAMGQPVPLSQFAGGQYGSSGQNDIAGLMSLMGMDPSKYAGLQRQQQPQAQAAQAQASGPPNNWQAAINALANPGNPVTRGANVPMQTGSQPAGGVNNAFLQQAGAGQGMNQNFLSALRAIQGR